MQLALSQTKQNLYMGRTFLQDIHSSSLLVFLLEPNSQKWRMWIVMRQFLKRMWKPVFIFYISLYLCCNENNHNLIVFVIAKVIKRPRQQIHRSLATDLLSEEIVPIYVYNKTIMNHFYATMQCWSHFSSE